MYVFTLGLIRMYCVCGAPATGLRHYYVALRMGDSDWHIEVSTTPEGKILQSFNSGKCEPKVVFEKLTAIITKKNPAWGRLFSFALEKKEPGDRSG